MTFDPKCYDLACAFLDDCANVTEAQRNELAGRIQQTIEDYGQELMDEEEAAKDAHIDAKIDEWRELGKPTFMGRLA